MSQIIGGSGLVLPAATPGYFWGGTLFQPSVSSNTGTVANQTNFHAFVLPYSITISKVSLNCAVGSASTNVGVGLYNAAKNKVFDSGARSSAAAGLISATVTAVLLAPGLYYIAWTCDSVTPTFSCTTVVLGGVMNNVAVHNGTGTASAAGVLPAALGTLTANAVPLIAAIFE